MYTSCTKTNVKANILKSFCCIGSHLRIVIATIAFSMGLDIPDLRPSDHLENYIQETGELEEMESYAVQYYIRTIDMLQNKWLTQFHVSVSYFLLTLKTVTCTLVCLVNVIVAVCIILNVNVYI